jgi:hypothetical protein
MPVFQRSILSLSSGLKLQSWEVEGLYRVRGRKVEGGGQSETRNRGKRFRTLGSLQAGY